MVYDVRKEDQEEITKVVFSDHGEIVQVEDFFRINDNIYAVQFPISDIDNLIKALEKANELWGGK